MFLFVASPHSEEGLCLYTKCASVETSVYPDKWEGCAHVIRITTPFVTNVTNGRPKSAPGAHWSPQFMCCLRCFMFECGVCVTFCPVYVLVICCGQCLIRCVYVLLLALPRCLVRDLFLLLLLLSDMADY